ncbi:MAG: DUF1294 domain-containing protein [Ruegeria sp.]
MKISNFFSFEAYGLFSYPGRMWIAVIYLWAINGLTLIAIGWDKSRASRKKRRIPERRLLWLAAIGGGPGALLGRWMFKHKTRKSSFSAWLMTILGVQGIVIYLILSESLPIIR